MWNPRAQDDAKRGYGSKKRIRSIMGRKQKSSFYNFHEPAMSRNRENVIMVCGSLCSRAA